MAEWWGQVEVSPGETVRWQLGPLILWLQRLEGEWRVFRFRLDDPLIDLVDNARAVPADEIDPKASVERFAVSGSSSLLAIDPQLPDRPIVSRPDRPFHVPPGEEVVLFVGSPLWVQIRSVEPAQRLFDMPVFRPSDTWFGPPTNEGELCYASRTYGLLRIDEAPLCPHRCVTALTIRNRASEEIVLERLKLPIAALDLYVAEGGRIWTRDVTFERRDDGEHARLDISRKPPKFASSPRLLVRGQGAELGDVVMRAFNTLFA